MDGNRILTVIASRYLTFAGLACGAGSIYGISKGEYLAAAVLGIASVGLLGWLGYNTIRNMIDP
jgi:phosphatidylserine synthase